MRNHRGPLSVRVCVRGGASLLGVCFAVGMLGLVAPARGGQISDNFDDGNDTADPAWTRYHPLDSLPPPLVSSPATFTFPGNNTYRIQASPANTPAATGPARAASFLSQLNVSTFSVSVDLVDWNNSFNQAFGVLARLSNIGPGSTNGYALTYAPSGGTIDITRITAESGNGNQLSTANVPLDPTRDYRLVFTGDGSSLTGAVYDLSALSSPLRTIAATDGTYANGITGVFVFDNTSAGTGPADATFDNFTASDTIPEPAGAAICGVLALVGLGARRRERE